MAKHAHEFAVIGLGRFGRSLASTLVERDFSVLGIDQDVQIVQRMADQLTQTLAFDSTDEDVLRSVDIKSFNTVFVAIGSHFESNLLTTVNLKNIGVHNVICKATTQQQRSILLKIGADRVILPEFEAGQRLAEEFTDPEILKRFSLGPDYSISEIRVPRGIVGYTLLGANLRQQYGINIIAVRRGDGLHVSPPTDFIFSSTDVLTIVGSNGDVARFARLR